MSYEPLRKAPPQPSTQKHNTQPRHRSTGSKSRYSVPQTTDEARHASFASSAPLAHSSEEPTKPAHSETLPGGFIAGTPPEQTESLPFRARMESAFGRNLGFVHVRTGAADAMRSIVECGGLGADQIAFAEARPGPWIVAHELAHVFQQHHAGGPSLRLRSSIAPDTSAAEIEADRVADRVSEGAPAGSISPQPEAGIHRFAPVHHQSATAAGLAKNFSSQEIGAIYAANWERDYSQVPPVVANAMLAWIAVKTHFYKSPEKTDEFKVLATKFKASIKELLSFDFNDLKSVRGWVRLAVKLTPSLGGTDTWEHMDAPDSAQERDAADKRWEGDRKGLSGYILDARRHIKEQIIAAFNVHRLIHNEPSESGVVTGYRGSVDPPRGYVQSSQERSGDKVSTSYPLGYNDKRVASRAPVVDETIDLAEGQYNARSDPNFDGGRWAPVAQHLGRAMHAFEDFWSHSNWLELAKLVYVREWKGDDTPLALRGAPISNSDLETGTFAMSAQIHALGHKLLALAKGFNDDVAVLVKVYDLAKPSEKLTSDEAKIRPTYIGKSKEPTLTGRQKYERPSVNELAFGTLVPTGDVAGLAVAGLGMAAAAGQGGLGIEDFLTNKEWLDSLAKLAQSMITAGHQGSGPHSHGTIAKDQLEVGKGHRGAMMLAVAANERTFGPLRSFMDKPWPEASAGVQGVLRMVDRMIQAPSVSHPLWRPRSFIEDVITADVE